MWFAVKFTILCTGLVLFIIRPTTCQDQCKLPTYDEIKAVAANITNELGTEGVVVTGSDIELFQVHFTCLATVARSIYTSMYAKATVVANFTTNSSSDSQVQQFQLRCVSGEWGRSPLSSFKDPASLAAMPFNIETQFQCSDCEQLPPTANYDSDSNCLSCATECLEIGGGFCTGKTANDCCPFFNSETGVCVDNCTTIDADFGPDQYFVCVCSIPCDLGFFLNTTNCSCSSCPVEGQVYKECMGCPPTCENYDEIIICPLICEPGCACPFGEVVDEQNNTCMPPEKCPESSTIVATTISIATSATPITPIEDPPYWIIAVVVVPLVAIAALAITIAIVLFIVRRRRRKSVTLEMKQTSR